MAAAGLLCPGGLSLAADQSRADPLELIVYAAASLRDALGALRPACEAEAGVRLLFNFGASNDLARQIIAAGKADAFFSADEEWMDKVAQAGLVDAGSRFSLLSNRLVVVGLKGISPAIASAGDLAGPGIRRLSLANPDAVPAGKYAKAWLIRAGVWDRLKDRVVPGLDVRAALATVESGAAEAGVVYRTDAMLSRKAQILFEVPDAEAPSISYPVAALSGRPHLEHARALVNCLAGSVGADTFRSFGFIVSPANR